ncbi:MAG: fructose 1,6-bisphosphatase, partial [Candidatus Aenigmarchaeota archaeon]|nr:fructose 1,6-bisphosphatase [Candidatus Aenigmarchaeota archaeon]
MAKITVTVIKADIGSIGGHTRPSEELLNSVKKFVAESKSAGMIIDSYVGYAGDDIHIVMSHMKGVNSKEIHKMAWDAFSNSVVVAKNQGLYGAGQDLLVDSFSGNVKGMGPGVAEMEFEERQNEAFAVFAADKTEPGAF